MSRCYSQIQPRHSVSPGKHFWSPEGAPQGLPEGDNHYCVTASHIRRWSSLPELGRGHSLLAALPGLAGSSHRAGKPRDLSPHCPVQQRLERHSCNPASSWHFSHSLPQTPPDSLLYHFQQLRTPCPTHTSSSPIRNGFIHRPTTMENRKDDLQQAFLHRRCEVVSIPCRRSGGERGRLDSSCSHLQKKTKKFSSQCCKTKQTCTEQCVAWGSPPVYCYHKGCCDCSP